MISEPTKISNLNKQQLIDIQTKLKKLNYYHDYVDGIYGKNTRNAFAQWKKDKYLSDPDIIGVSSYKQLTEEVGDIKVKVEPFAQRIVQVCDERNYPLLKKGELNIIGVEGVEPNGTPNNDSINYWNDTILLLQYVDGVPTIVWRGKGTTEPGRFYTINLLNKNGVARLQVGHHKKIWSVGRHRGYEALSQTGPAILVRDKNRNHLRDDVVTTEWNNGINLHSTSPNFLPNIIDKFSAGCVVIQRWSEFQQFMKIIKSSKEYKSNKYYQFDFILLWRDWLK